ncbi:MAG: ADP-ribosylglycohydrolase family protein [Chloroflexota bacterium]
MSDQVPNAKERYIGALLGMAIGDALAMPAAGLSREQITERYGKITGYRPKLDENGEVIEEAGQFSADTELALCLAETIVTANGFVDPEIAGERFIQVMRGPQAHFLSETTRASLKRADESGDFQGGVVDDRGEAHPAARSIPVALAHALSESNPELVVREVMRSVLITHAGLEIVNAALAVSHAMRLIIRREVPPEVLIGEVLAFIDEDDVARHLRKARRIIDGETEAGDEPETLARLADAPESQAALAAAFYLFAMYPDEFETAVLKAANLGGGLHSVGSIVGAFAGAHVGASNIPKHLIEGLEGRMYFLMAAPTLLRTAQQRGGLFFHLQQS